jgi:hypothetical protein
VELDGFDPADWDNSLCLVDGEGRVAGILPGYAQRRLDAGVAIHDVFNASDDERAEYLQRLPVLEAAIKASGKAVSWADVARDSGLPDPQGIEEMFKILDGLLLSEPKTSRAWLTLDGVAQYCATKRLFAPVADQFPVVLERSLGELLTLNGLTTFVLSNSMGSHDLTLEVGALFEKKSLRQVTDDLDRWYAHELVILSGDTFGLEWAGYDYEFLGTVNDDFVVPPDLFGPHLTWIEARP